MKKIFFVLALLAMLVGSVSAAELNADRRCALDPEVMFSGNPVFEVVTGDGFNAEEDCMLEDNIECIGDCQNTCEDTDAGIDPFVKGSVSGKMWINNDWFDYKFDDFCDDCGLGQLFEWHCVDTGDCGSVPSFVIVDCEYGCKDGACGTEIPEFGFAAAGIALVGALAGFMFLRKRH